MSASETEEPGPRAGLALSMQSRLGGNNAASDRASRVRPDLGSRGLRAMSLAISFLLHVIAIVLYPSIVRTLRPAAVNFPVASRSGPMQGSVVLRLIDIDESANAERPEEPEEIEEVEAPEASTDNPVLERIPSVILVPPGPTPAERFMPNLGDARLWVEPPPEFYELTLEEREELLLADRIVEWYDSVALVRAAEERLTDWTFRDSDGKRWGVSDGRIYLGDIALPLPLSFGTPVGKRDETNRLLWEFEEISRQSQRYLIEQTWKERSAAIRARKDRERAAERADTTGIG